MSDSDSTTLQQIIIFLMSSAQLTLQIIFHFFARLCLLSIYLCGCIFTDLITTYVQTGKEIDMAKAARSGVEQGAYITCSR